MSIAQLREALFQAKEWGKQEEERKRQDVRAMQEKVL
jgi:chaperone required for assembly of F1-ATPase